MTTYDKIERTGVLFAFAVSAVMLTYFIMETIYMVSLSCCQNDDGAAVMSRPSCQKCDAPADFLEGGVCLCASCALYYQLSITRQKPSNIHNVHIHNLWEHIHSHDGRRQNVLPMRRLRL